MFRKPFPEILFVFLLAFLLPVSPAVPQEEAGGVAPAPPRTEGEGPFARLILRGVTLIDGTGAPPLGPVDIVIEEKRIRRIVNVGWPGLPIPPEKRPAAGPGGRELDTKGMYVLPGLVDLHAHIGGKAQGTPAEYVFKLWMGHGITTIRDPGSGNGLAWTLKAKAQSEKNEITAPRIVPYVVFGQGHEGPITTPEEARVWVRKVAGEGAAGIKFFGAPPAVFRAALEEAGRLGLGSACHHAQLAVARANVLDTSSWGLTTMEHWYGLPEALFTDRTVQDYPPGYNYNDEADRFGEAGRLWKQAAPPFSPHWNEVMDTLLRRGLTLVPTFTIYDANRDLMRARRAEWHELYTLPSLWDFYRPSRKAHGSYWYSWSTRNEIDWKENFRLWMTFVNEYKNRGGRVCVGSDSGFIYKLNGFGTIRELELLQEAGFHPLEVVRAATLAGAEVLKMDDRIGSVEPGKLADLLIVEENPLEDFKVLYGTGAIRLDEHDQPVRVGGVRYTIKDGIVFDARRLRADVRAMVRKAWQAAGRKLEQPGWETR